MLLWWIMALCTKQRDETGHKRIVLGTLLQMLLIVGWRGWSMSRMTSAAMREGAGLVLAPSTRDVIISDQSD